MKGVLHAELQRFLGLVLGCCVVASILCCYADAIPFPGTGSSEKYHSTADTYAPKTLYVYNLNYTASLSPADAYEHTLIVSALCGMLHQVELDSIHPGYRPAGNAPNFALYVLWTDADALWLQHLQAGDWSSTTVANLPNGDLTTLIQTIRGLIPLTSVVVYDPDVPATSNVASTIAGADHLLPVRANSSAFETLVLSTRGPKLLVGMSLVGKFDGSRSGSKKCDAYVWAIENYVKTGKAYASVLGYYVDYYWTTEVQPGSDYLLNTVGNQDWVIANHGFVFDLSIWDDAAPNDDPTQPLGTDLRTLEALLMAGYEQAQTSNGNGMVYVSGFTPWAFKYVKPYSKHEGVETEWQTMKVFSSYNAFADADACCIGAMANGALFQWITVPDRLVQAPPPSLEMLKSKGYVTDDGHIADKTFISFYVGDYDSSAWLYSQLINKWNDTARGTVPLGWAIDPELSRRFPLIFSYLYGTRSPMDVFTTGDSGAGYLNPTQLFPPRFPSNISESGATAWRTWNEHFYNWANMKFTGFVIQGFSGAMTTSAEDMYSAFSPLGIVLSEDVDPVDPSHTHLQGNMPVFHHVSDLPGGDPESASKLIEQIATETKEFYVFRSILQPASYHAQIMTAVEGDSGGRIQVVDPLTLSMLSRLALNGSNDNIVSYVGDSIPPTVSSRSCTNVTLSATVQVRNDGWNVLNTSSDVVLCLNVSTPTTSMQNCTVSADGTVAWNETAQYSLQVQFDSFPATVTYGLQTAMGKSFRSFGIPDYRKVVTCTAAGRNGAGNRLYTSVDV